MIWSTSLIPSEEEHSVSIPKLLRQVRKAISQENYPEAEMLYEKILQFPEMADDLDIRVRYASCTEKNGNRDQAIDAYCEVLKIYQERDEKGAAASIEKILEGLRSKIEEIQPEPALETDVEPLSDAELMKRLCDMGEYRSLRAGDILCREGEMPDSLWLLRSGSIMVHLPEYDEPDIIEVKEGHLALVGELGFFTDQRRAADLEVATEAELFEIKTADIRHQKEQEPAFKAAMKRLLYERWAEPVLTRHTVFERVNDIDRMRLMRTFDRVTLGPGEVLIEAGEEHSYAYMLQSGCMFFMHSKDHLDDSADSGDGSMMTSIFPADMVHLGGLLAGYKSEYRVVTATPVKLLRLSQQDFEPFTLRRPWIIQAILQFSRRPAHLQLMKPDDDYLWKADRHVKTH